MTTNFKFALGCDPEVFVTKRGKPASAYGILEGTKEEPYRVGNGAYQVDGMAAEFNTDPVPIVSHYDSPITNSFNVWNDRIAEQIENIKTKLKETGHRVRITPTMEFGKEFLDNQPEAAKILGCDPDYSAYTLKPNPRPDGEKTFRTAAGHIHIGWGADIPVENEDHLQICAEFVKTLDATVGMFMTYIDRDPLRRELYGKAGAFRPKPYGVEYRTPSNLWITNRDRRQCIFDLVQLAIKEQRNGRRPSVEGLTAQEIIDTGNHEAAYVALDKMFREDWRRRYMYYDFKFAPHFRRVFKSVEKEYANNAN